jgi:hypothetical protein
VQNIQSKILRVRPPLQNIQKKRVTGKIFITKEKAPEGCSGALFSFLLVLLYSFARSEPATYLPFGMNGLEGGGA